jgi:flagellar biosynthesis/type III secretory pathway protein FliH
MAKQRIEKTLVILNEDELRQVMRLAQQNDPEAIYKFVREVIAKRVEEAIRRRCG